jgi:hypothetical protein
MARNESNLWKYLKENTPSISWTRLENSSVQGTPDLLGYNKKGHFFTVELKVAKHNKVKISPHQISFHLRHSLNSFILVKAIVSGRLKLYEGKQIQSLVTSGLELKSLVEGLEDCLKVFEEV